MLGVARASFFCSFRFCGVAMAYIAGTGKR